MLQSRHHCCVEDVVRFQFSDIKLAKMNFRENCFIVFAFYLEKPLTQIKVFEEFVAFYTTSCHFILAFIITRKYEKQKICQSMCPRSNNRPKKVKKTAFRQDVLLNE